MCVEAQCECCAVCSYHFSLSPPSPGTLRPDLIESASLLVSSAAAVIKTHHNDTQLVRELRRKVCEGVGVCIGISLHIL